MSSFRRSTSSPKRRFYCCFFSVGCDWRVRASWLLVYSFCLHCIPLLCKYFYTTKKWNCTLAWKTLSRKLGSGCKGLWLKFVQLSQNASDRVRRFAGCCGDPQTYNSFSQRHTIQWKRVYAHVHSLQGKNTGFKCVLAAGVVFKCLLAPARAIQRASFLSVTSWGIPSVVII